MRCDECDGHGESPKYGVCMACHGSGDRAPTADELVDALARGIATQARGHGLELDAAWVRAWAANIATWLPDFGRFELRGRS